MCRKARCRTSGFQSPELIFEILSPDDRWSEVQTKVDEYLQGGATVVCVVNDEIRNIHVFRADRPGQMLRANDELTLPDILPGFAIPVQRIFE